MRRALLIAEMLFVATPLHAQQVDPKVSARIDHVAQIAGHDHVGIGGDRDQPPHTETLPHQPALTAAK